MFISTNLKLITMKKNYTIIMILFLFSAGVVNAQNLLSNGDFEEGKDPVEGWRPLHWDWNDDGGALWVEMVETGNTGEPIQAAEGQFCYRLMFNPSVNNPGSDMGGTLWQTLADENYFSGNYEFSFDVNYSGIQRWLNEGQEYVNSATGEIVVQIATIDDDVETLLVNETFVVDSAMSTNGWTTHALEDISISSNDSVKVMIKCIKANNLYGTTLYIDNVYFAKAEDNVSIKNNTVGKDFFMYPNPAENVVNITNTSYVIDQISISDLSGKLIYQEKAISNSIDVSHFSKGVYIVTLHSDNDTYNQMLMVK